MRLAASNIGWSSQDDKAVFHRMSELGFSGVEVAPTRIAGDNPYRNVPQATSYVNTVSSEYGLSVCSMQSIWYGLHGNIFNDSDVVELTEHTKEAIAFAHSIGCKNIVFGCPRQRAIPDGKSPSEAEPFFLSCATAANERNILFALEANPPIYETNFLNSTEDVHRYIQQMGYPPGLAINLDIGAMICEGESVRAIEHLLPYVSHVHISEPHLAPVSKRLMHKELKSALCDFDYKGFVSLEMRTQDLNTVLASLEYMAEVFL